MREHVWYVAYGSNMDQRRLGLYLHGGEATFGSTAVAGVAPPFASPPPSASRWVEPAGRCYFDGRSGSWGGAVAFLDVAERASRFHGRAWRITRDQLAWIAARENRSDTWERVARLDLAEPHVMKGWRWYGGIEPLGELDGEPMVTVTRPRGAPPLSQVPEPRPHDYLVAMHAALAEHLGPEAALVALSDPWPYAAGVERDEVSERRVAAELDALAAATR